MFWVVCVGEPQRAGPRISPARVINGARTHALSAKTEKCRGRNTTQGCALKSAQHSPVTFTLAEQPSAYMPE